MQNYIWQHVNSDYYRIFIFLFHLPLFSIFLSVYVLFVIRKVDKPLQAIKINVFYYL